MLQAVFTLVAGDVHDVPAFKARLMLLCSGWCKCMTNWPCDWGSSSDYSMDLIPQLGFGTKQDHCVENFQWHPLVLPQVFTLRVELGNVQLVHFDWTNLRVRYFIHSGLICCFHITLCVIFVILINCLVHKLSAFLIWIERNKEKLKICTDKIVKNMFQKWELSYRSNLVTMTFWSVKIFFWIFHSDKVKVFQKEIYF